MTCLTLGEKTSEGGVEGEHGSHDAEAAADLGCHGLAGKMACSEDPEGDLEEEEDEEEGDGGT